MDLIKFYKYRVDDKLPNHIQRLFLYQCCTFFTWNSLINHPERARMLNAEERKRFLSYLDAIFEEIDPNVVLDFELGGLWFYHKVGILNALKGAKPPFQIVYVHAFDRVRNQVQLGYFCGETESEEFQIDGREVCPVYSKAAHHRSEEHTSELQSLMRISYAVFCL